MAERPKLRKMGAGSKVMSKEGSNSANSLSPNSMSQPHSYSQDQAQRIRQRRKNNRAFQHDSEQLNPHPNRFQSRSLHHSSMYNQGKSQRLPRRIPSQSRNHAYQAQNQLQTTYNLPQNHSQTQSHHQQRNQSGNQNQELEQQPPLHRQLETQRLLHDLRSYQAHIENLSMVIESENRLLQGRAKQTVELEDSDNGGSDHANDTNSSPTRRSDNSVPLIAPRPRFAIRFLNAPESESEMRQSN